MSSLVSHPIRLIALSASLLFACGPSARTSGDDTGADAAPHPNVDSDGDGYTPAMGDCNDANPAVNPGATETCNGVDDDCNGLIDEPFDLDHDGSTTCGGDCNDNDPNIHPGAPPDCSPGGDSNCDGAPDSTTDADADGYTACNGDCNDSNPLVNPGAVEVQTNMDGSAEGVDNNCNGQVDEPATPCDAALSPSDPLSYAKAMGLCDWVTSVTITADAPAAARSIVSSYGSTYVPHEGANMGVIGTGNVEPLPQSPQPGTAFTNTHSNPDPIPSGAGCPFPSPPPATVNDYIEINMTIKVPTNAKAFSYDFNFMSAEYPEFVCTEFNDTFLAMLQSSVFTGNISFDSMGNPVTINNGFFTVCPTGMGGCTGDAPLNGTGMEGQTGGGTGWLTTTSPVGPGETINLRLILFDEGDHIYDSTVLLDNWRWEADPVSGPVTVGRDVPPNARPIPLLP